MPHFVTGRVEELLEQRDGLQRVRVARNDDGPGDRAYVLTQVIGEVAVGDHVVLNTTAVELGLGTGGWHVVHWNLSRSEVSMPSGGHIMKARYSSEQLDVRTSEESADLATDLDGMPVVICLLLSQAAVVAVACRSRKPDGSLALVVTDRSALPVAISDVIADLRTRGVVKAVYSCGQAFGGDHEVVTTASALLHARASGATTAIVTQGPGVVGTSTGFGFSGFDLVGVVDLVRRLGGVPIVAVRYSGADARERHRGVSHHTQTFLRFCEGGVIPLPLPSADSPDGDVLNADRHEVRSYDVGDVGSMLAESGVVVSTMGRSFDEDPDFFRFAAAAGVAAAGFAASSN